MSIVNNNCMLCSAEMHLHGTEHLEVMEEVHISLGYLHMCMLDSAEKGCLMRSFMICTLHQIFLW